MRRLRYLLLVIAVPLAAADRSPAGRSEAGSNRPGVLPDFRPSSAGTELNQQILRNAEWGMSRGSAGISEAELRRRWAESDREDEERRRKQAALAQDMGATAAAIRQQQATIAELDAVVDNLRLLYRENSGIFLALRAIPELRLAEGDVIMLGGPDQTTARVTRWDLQFAHLLYWWQDLSFKKGLSSRDEPLALLAAKLREGALKGISEQERLDMADRRNKRISAVNSQLAEMRAKAGLQFARDVPEIGVQAGDWLVVGEAALEGIPIATRRENQEWQLREGVSPEALVEAYAAGRIVAGGTVRPQAPKQGREVVF